MGQKLESFVTKNRLFIKSTRHRRNVVISGNPNTSRKTKRYRQQNWSIEIIPSLLQILWNPIGIKKNHLTHKRYPYADGLTRREARSKLLKIMRGGTLVFPDVKNNKIVEAIVPVDLY